MTLTIGSMFAGYGGLDLALDPYGYRTAWTAELDPSACRVLAARFPDAPNLGDVTELDDAPPVDIIAAGFPCQPFSTAGKRLGSTDERFLFDDIARTAGRMVPRPALFLENVRGLLTIEGGDTLAGIIHRLAELGYVGAYRTLAASDVGAPHRRVRWFCLAIPADTDGARFQRTRTSPGPRPRPAHRCRAASPDPDRERLQERRLPDGPDRPDVPDPARRGRFGPYQAAVDRWAGIIGRPAPEPLTDGRLSPRFVEWMMGLAPGWVTDPTLELTRAQALKMLGNGVVPQQAFAAFHLLTHDLAPEADQ